ncbi:DUF4169 family protein [Roseovarius aestuarii]|uniref:Uncharacterized protein n=1 Tax=Roseovarius aestuarii TaxID=475083 RepID=A0A1X7BRK8_9RHOB|nr:DUF4169 family protein [Roseovarius aestuarii]SMC12251.1 hypothetical protein ROA7745_02074 [Roseovarius aestuarii]
MAEPVNLNRFRKAKARADRKAQASENAVKFGRTKAEKDLEKARTDKACAEIERHKLDE